MGYIAVVDYGVGNLSSVVNAMTYLGFSSLISADSDDLERADAIILPGVGAFPDAIDKLRATNLDSKIALQAKRKPVLGICLGMQLLFDKSSEIRCCSGLGLIPGKIDRIQTQLKLPHIGWNSLAFPNDCPLFRGVEEGAYVYFVHSFCAYADNNDHVAATTDYGGPVIAAVWRDHVYGCQFHPEKSGETGLQILRNFGELNR